MMPADLVAIAMLLAGAPAQVLRVIQPDGSGHNILEVWDRTGGWNMFVTTSWTAYCLKGDRAASPTCLTTLILGRWATGTGRPVHGPYRDLMARAAWDPAEPGAGGGHRTQ